MNVGIYIYPDAEVLDFSGPFEVFSAATRVADDGASFDLFLVAEHAETVTARGGYRVAPAFSFDDHPPIGLLIVVGGVHDAEMEKPAVLRWIAEQAGPARCIASVCTGAFLLAAAGVLTTQTVTTHWEDIPALRAAFPRLDVVDDVRWVDDGEIVTSGGISAGIDMSLHLVSRFGNPGLAEKTARQMEFRWTKAGRKTTPNVHDG